MNDLTEQEEPFFSLSLDVFLPVTLPSNNSDLFEYSLLPVAPPLKTALRLAASASLHALYSNAQLMSGYMTFILFSARAVSQSPSNAALCQVACCFWRKYSWEQRGRTGLVFLTLLCGLFQAGKLAAANLFPENCTSLAPVPQQSAGLSVPQVSQVCLLLE